MKMIYTDISALYKQKLISYYPSRKHVEMILGTNTLNYDSAKYKISLQKEETYKIGIIEKDDEYMYGPERLFVELNKFKMENTIKNEAIKNLKKVINPEKVKKIYDKLKKRRNSLDKKSIEKFLDENLLNIKEKISSAIQDERESIIREYIMALISKKNIPISLIKGGSAIELFTPINRTTNDIDIHAANLKSVDEIIKYLESRDRSIYFKSNDYEDKKIIKINLSPISKGGTHKKELEKISILITFNLWYDDNELKEIINYFQITKRRLKHLPNAMAIIFTREMLLAEKFQSIISKPKVSIRTKDLIDIKIIWNDDIDFNKFRKWLFRKWKRNRVSKNEEEAKRIIEENKNKKLIKIKDNFEDAIKMYDIHYSFLECLKKYKILIKESLK